jgi:hypothetical protein
MIAWFDRFRPEVYAPGHALDTGASNEGHVGSRAGTDRRHHPRLRVNLNIIKRQFQYQNVDDG